MNYLYELEVHATDEDGEPITRLVRISAYSEESLLEQLRKADKSIKDYEGEQEARAQMAYSEQKENNEL